ncbi:hypothetical protein [Flavobacterium chungangense]|uniref:hypothetical protein n=1 Tax=Flavobacterium chungangense TaxID=554283 RepID=UPI0004DFBD6E|nr:hypothetical protein [Flavobacterium chungangense]
MKSFFFIITFFFINFGNQETDKLKGSYNCIVENEYYNIQKNKITFNDSIYAFDNKFIPKGKVSYKSIIVLDNFINPDLIVSIFKNQITKDTIQFSIHNKKDGGNYLDIASGKGKFIKIK